MSKAETIRKMMNPANDLYLRSVMGAGNTEKVLDRRSLMRLAWRARNVFTILADAGVKGEVKVIRLGLEAREGNMEFVVSNPDAADLPTTYQSFRMITRINWRGDTIADWARLYVGQEVSSLPVLLENGISDFTDTLYASVASAVGQTQWSSLPDKFPNLRVQARNLTFNQRTTRGFHADFQGSSSGQTHARIYDNTVTSILQYSRNAWVAADGAFDAFLRQKFDEDFGGKFSEIMEYFYADVSSITNKMVFTLKK